MNAIYGLRDMTLQELYERLRSDEEFVLYMLFEKQLFLDSKKRFHALGMRNSDSLHKITPKGIISREKSLKKFTFSAALQLLVNRRKILMIFQKTFFRSIARGSIFMM